MMTTGSNSGALGSDAKLGLVAKDRWYVVSVDGRATLCASEGDARHVERECNLAYPGFAPHRAVMLGDVSAERQMWSDAVSQAQRDRNHAVQVLDAALSALLEVDLLAGHDDAMTEWRDKWAHLWALRDGLT